MKHDSKQNIAILGSTGSIGTQTLDIIAENENRFHADILTARSNWELLAQQALRFHPSKVVIADDRYYLSLKEALASLPIKVESGAEAIAEAAGEPQIDTVVTAMVGYSGLLPTINAIRNGKRIALANKETLVVAGEVITRLLKNSESEIIPVDSEHSAIFQSLIGENRQQASKIILTASGGPFRTWNIDKLYEATPQDALRHPNWEMGAKVTIDSASMMNKGFEMIEARWLFDFSPEDIEIVVHPQSIVHSMVEFYDGSVKAQLGLPDMRIPISLALGYPDRLYTSRPSIQLHHYSSLTFEEPDLKKFPLLGMAYQAIKAGGNMPCILNAANEVAVEAFLKGKIRFTDMPLLVEEVMQTTPYISEVELQDLITTNKEAFEIAKDKITHYNN